MLVNITILIFITAATVGTDATIKTYKAVNFVFRYEMS
jgi:hypothetical protein